MKKKNILLFFSFCFLALFSLKEMAYAQERLENTNRDFFRAVRWGFFVAPSVDWGGIGNGGDSKGGKFNTISLNNGQLGFKIGATVFYGWESGLGVESGLHYNNTRANFFTRRIKGSDLASRQINVADIDYNLGFLEIPINLKYTSPELVNNLRLFANAGLGISFLLHKQAAMEINYNNKNGVTENYISDFERIKGWNSVRPISLFGTGGIGVQYDVDYKRTVYFGVVYQNNFIPDMTSPKNIKFEFGEDYDFNDGSTRLNNVAFRLGLMF